MPLAEGQATIQASAAGGFGSSLQVQVTNIERDLPVNFPNQVVPIFTKYGCNSGGCHGKSGGQNGFRLSLLGFEPTEDFEYLVKEGRGRVCFLRLPSKVCCYKKRSPSCRTGAGIGWMWIPRPIACCIAGSSRDALRKPG